MNEEIRIAGRPPLSAPESMFRKMGSSTSGKSADRSECADPAAVQILAQWPVVQSRPVRSMAVTNSRRPERTGSGRHMAVGIITGNAGPQPKE